MYFSLFNANIGKYSLFSIATWTFHFLCSSGSDYRKAPPTVDLNQFICTEKIRYLGEFDLESDNSSSEDETESFGQEFYLGNSILYTPV